MLAAAMCDVRAWLMSVHACVHTLPLHLQLPCYVHSRQMCVDYREISVQWLTRDAGNPTVHYGTSSGSLTSNKIGNTTSYTRQDMCGAAANSYGWIDPGTMSNVVLTNLTPSTTYYYTYGDPVST